LTKKAQINMQRFAKQMSGMKPEIDKLQKKYGSDPKRMQQEQMKLMREHGVNPFSMLGCLPMFLQMPIWIALWAMLYLAFDIRHEPAFYGVFQLFGDWNFLGDLSSPDHFWMLPGGGFTLPFGIAHIDALNLLPLLLGVVFFIQQKYLSPPPTPNMTPEQKQQQKIMKIMMVVLFPLFLYKAPSGLTLYIFTSTCIGIMESKYIRAHIDQMDLVKAANGGSQTTAKKPKGALARMWAEKLEAAKAKRMAEPSKTFKKRK
jgi:YidC/Oxa1 family membrane protein insertase